MLQSFHPRKACAALAIVLASVSMFGLQQPKEALRAPLPTQIVTAKKAFISYAGGDIGPAGYSGEADRTYNQFYAAIKSCRQYEIVPTPGAADLVLEISFIDPIISVKITGRGESLSGSSVNDPQFRLAIREPKSNLLLWTLSSHIQAALLAGNRDKNFNQAMDSLLDDIKKLAQPTSMSEGSLSEKVIKKQ